MASSVWKQGAKALGKLPLPSNHAMCVKCCQAMHVSSAELTLFNVSPKPRFYLRPRINRPDVYHNRTNRYLHPPMGCGVALAGHRSIKGFDPLQNEIAMATTVEGLFGAVCTNRTFLNIHHVCSIIQKMNAIVEIEPCLETRKNLALFVKEHSDFIKMCSTAEQQVGALTSDELTDTMQAMVRFLHTNEEDPLPFVQELFIEGTRRLHSFNTHQLAKFAQYIRFTYQWVKHVPALGSIADRFSQVLDELDHNDLQELLALMTATVEVSSGELQNRVLGKITEVMRTVVKQNIKLTGSDVSSIVTYEWKAYRDRSYPELNELCSLVMQQNLDNVSIVDLFRMNTALVNLKDISVDLCDAINVELLKRLPLMTDTEDIGLTIELLSRSSRYNSQASALILEKVRGLLQCSEPPLDSICIALRRIRHQSLSPLVKDLIACIKQTDLTIYEIMPICEYFRFFKEQDGIIEELYEVLTTKLCELRKTSLSPLLTMKILYCLSLMPAEILEHTDLDLPSYSDLLPQFNDRYTNLLSVTLKRVKFKLKDAPEACHGLQQLIDKVNYQVVCNLDQNDSIHHLNNIAKYIIQEGGCDVVFLEKAMKQYTDKLVQIKNPQVAVKCANILSMAEYLHAPLMDKIAEVVTSKINGVNPSQIGTILAPFCNLRYDPPNADEFYQACINRILPFLDNVEADGKSNPFYLVSLAFGLSLAQKFPEELLKRIFTVDFLDKFDEALKGASSQGKTLMEACYRRRMMHLNRTMVLECPELQIPWFHEEYCQMVLRRRSAKLSASEEELQSVLVEVLGGAQYLRSQVVGPYYMGMLFEFVLDPEGSPLPIADYGSVLNFGKVSNRVMSDLMQWGTQAKTLPKGSQRVAIDYMHPGCYNINSSSLFGGYSVKRRQMEIMGYRLAQIPYYEWKSTTLPEKADKVDYLQEVLFGNQKSSALSGPITVLQDEIDPKINRKGLHSVQRTIAEKAVTLPGYTSLGGMDLRIREEDMMDDPALIRALDHLTSATEGRQL